MVFHTQQWINAIFYASMAQKSFHTCTMQEPPPLIQESLWCLIPSNGLAQTSMLPLHRTFPTLPRFRIFSSFVLGIIMALDTQQWISTIVYASIAQGPYPHFHVVGTSTLLFQKSLWWLISIPQSFLLPRCRTFFTHPWCRNFSSLVLGIILVLDT